MTDRITVYRVEDLMFDTKTGEPMMMRQRGPAYPTLFAATKAAKSKRSPWIIVAECVVAMAPEVEATFRDCH